jgi:hypothetical protein
MHYGVPGISSFAAGIPSLAAGGPPPVSFELPKNVYRFGEQTLWSSLFLAQGAAVANSVNRVFTTPLGQQGQGFGAALSIAETNLKEGGRIPSGIAFDAFGVSASVAHSNNATDDGSANAALAFPLDDAVRIGDLNNVITNSVLTWDFTQTQVDVCPTNLAGAGGGAFGALAATGGAGPAQQIGSMQNGNGAVWLYRKHPVALPGNSTFSMLIRFGSRAPVIGAEGSVAVRVVLLGYYKNVIEVA